MTDRRVLEAIDCATYFRQGLNLRGEETFTPRMLLFDRMDAMGASQKYNALYHEMVSEDEPLDTWEGDVSVKNKKQAKSNIFLSDLNQTKHTGELYPELDEQVQSWGDYNRLFYHPRSIQPVTLGVSSNMNLFSEGLELGRCNEFMDRVLEEDFRFFLEECDHLDGLNVSVDLLDGFGGLASEFLKQVRLDLPKIPIVTFGFEHGSLLSTPSPRNTFRSKLNHTLAASSLLETSSLYIPIDPSRIQQDLDQPWHQHLSSDFSLPYHSSALISSAISSLLFSTMLRQNDLDYSYMCASMNWQRDTNMAHLSSAFPVPLTPGTTMDATLEQWTSYDALRSFSLNPEPSKLTSQLLVACGVHSDNTLKGTDVSDKCMSKNALQLAFAKKLDCRMTQSQLLDFGYPVYAPFPAIFKNTLTLEGYVASSEKESAHPLTERDLPTLTHLFNSKQSGEVIKGYLDRVKPVKMSHVHEYASELTQDDLDECCEVLDRHAEAYAE